MKLMVGYVVTAICCLAVAVNAKYIDLEIQSSEDIGDTREIVKINGTFYYISVRGIDVTALEALRLCNDVGMKLISIQTEEKQQMIAEYLQENGHSNRIFWTSGVGYMAGIYTWLGTGMEFTYTNWYQGQPDDPSQDICVYFDTVNNKWSDAPCSGKRNFMCEELSKC